MRISDWSPDVCSSDLLARGGGADRHEGGRADFAPPHLDGAGAGLAVGRGNRKGKAGICHAARCRIERRARQGRKGALQPFLRSRSEEHTSELQSLMRISDAVFCLKKKTTFSHSTNITHSNTYTPYQRLHTFFHT